MKTVTFAFRLDRDLRDAFYEAVAMEGISASQVLRNFMEDYVKNPKQLNGDVRLNREGSQ